MQGQYFLNLMICLIGIQLIQGEFHRRFLFGELKTKKTKTIDSEQDVADNNDDDSNVTVKPQLQKNESLSRLLEKFLSTNKKSDQQSSTNSFSKLNILKEILSSSSSSNDNNSKFGKLFHILNNSAQDKQNDESPSSSKLTRLLGLFKNQDQSSTNIQLAMKLLNLAQGKASLNSFNFDELKSLAKIFG